MGKFRFQLEPLLRLREREERDRQVDVANLERERRVIEERLRAQQASITNGQRELRSTMVGQLDVGALRSHAARSVELDRSARRMVLELAGVHRRLELAREALREARRARRAIELLKERRYEAWKAAIEKAETAALDELAVQRAARKESS
jgi:flagellar export protein FliJ